MSIEEKYDEVRQLISIGKEKGYLLYDEVNELLPADITSSDELDDLFSTFGSAGIEVVDSEKTYREDKLLDRTGEGAEELELDLTPGALDKTNDPVRMYLREMGTVPLLTREGEVEIAKRIERGKLAVIKSISRTPTTTRTIMQMGDALKADERSIRELATFVDEELTEDKIEDRKRQVLRQIDAVRKAWAQVEKCREKLDKTPKGTMTREKRKYRRARWESLRARVELSQLLRKIEFTENIKRRLIDQIKESVEGVMRLKREVDQIERQLNPKNKKIKLKEDDRKNLLRRQKDVKLQMKSAAEEVTWWRGLSRSRSRCSSRSHRRVPRTRRTFRSSATCSGRCFSIHISRSSTASTRKSITGSSRSPARSRCRTRATISRNASASCRRSRT